MFPNINACAFSAIVSVFGVVLVVVGTERSLTRVERQVATSGVCEIPEPLVHGRYRASVNRCPPSKNSPACLMTPGAFVPNDWVIFFKCDDGYVPNTTYPVSFCKNGRWDPPLPFCKREVCPALNAFGVDIRCMYSGQTVPCAEPMRPGTIATLTCQDGYHLPFVPLSTQLTCLDVGAWDYQTFYCLPDKAEEVSTTSHKPPFATTSKPLPEVQKCVQKCQEYGETVRAGTCAMSKAPVTGLVDAEPHEYPHMAMIGVRRNARIIWKCAGSLISERFVLGCGRCCEDKWDSTSWILGRFARLGANDIISTKHESRATDYDIMERFVHPYVDDFNVYYDIALFKLKENVIFNDFIRPICLQTEERISNTYALTTGWWYNFEKGEPHRNLQKDNLTIVGSDQCFKLNKNEQLRKGNFNIPMVCAKHLTEPTECRGYWLRGAPLQYRLQKPHCMYSQVGIHILDTFCYLGDPWVYIRVSHFVPWIESIVWA